jgi:hypothetical protein
VLIDSQGDENTSVGATDKAVTSVLVVAVNCTTVAW